MTVTIQPGPRSGSVRIPASKSQAHRLLICAALGQEETVLNCDGISKDIAATIRCLQAMGAVITQESEAQLRIRPIGKLPTEACHLFCGESGSTLRFLLPIVGALGLKAVFHMEGRLPQRPLSPLDERLTAHGMTLRREDAMLFCEGKLTAGAYEIPGNISSQYITGLLLALPLLSEDSRLSVTGPVESAAYITMTEDALRLSEVAFEKKEWEYRIPGRQRPSLPPITEVEGDYSNAAFFLCAGALSREGIRVLGLRSDSSQGDRAVLEILRRFGAQVSVGEKAIHVSGGALHGIEIDASPIPDLVPVLSVVAAAAEGETRIVKAGRLRLKESDRLRSTADLLSSLRVPVEELPEGLVIRGGRRLSGGEADSWGDHRIAMSAAVAATVADGPVTVTGAECVEKSYPRFWADYEQLTGGKT